MNKVSNQQRVSATTFLKKAVVALVMLCTFSFGVDAKGPVMAQDTLTAGEVFANLPIKVLDILPRTSRLDMLDYAAVDSLRPTTNNMGEISVLKSVSRTALDVRLTNVSQLDIRLLPFKGSEIALIIYTVGRPDSSPDSQLNFFDSAMTELPVGNFITLPQIEDFLIDKNHWKTIGSNMTRKDVINRIPFITVTYSMKPGSLQLMAELTIGKFMPQEDYDAVAPFLNRQLVYTWNGKKFMRNEE